MLLEARAKTGGLGDTRDYIRLTYPENFVRHPFASRCWAVELSLH